MDLLVDALLQYETLDAEDLKAILDGNPENVKAKMSSTNKSIKGDEKSGGGGGGKTIPAEGAANLPGSQRPREILSVT